MTGVACAVLFAGCGDGALRIDARDATQVAAGEAVYAQHCAACHGANLEGQPDWRRRLPNGRLPAPPHDASGHTWHHPDQMLFAITKHGLVPPHAPAGYQSDMPAFAGVLSDDEIRAVLAYIQSRWPKEIIEARAEMLRAR
ncbi:MAG: cytochrome c [Burkholderiales bacterium]|nr:cytochrome c [Burkholderiales bacterium]